MAKESTSTKSSGSKVHEKIILSAITFWFKDEDAKEGKVRDYFND